MREEETVAQSERAFWASDFAAELDISTSKLRRWSIELEKKGYEFYRDEHNKRGYFESDLEPFRKLKELIEIKKMRVDESMDIVVSLFPTSDRRGQMSVSNSNDTITISRDELQELISESVKKAVEDERDAMFNGFEQRLNNVIERRDMQVVHQFKAIQEQNFLQLGASQEDEKDKDNDIEQQFVKLQEELKILKEEQNKKQGFFKRLFGG